MKLFPEETRKYLSCDTVENDQENEHKYSVEFLNNLTAGSALPDHELNREKGDIVMLLLNIGSFKRHLNRSKFSLSDMAPDTLHPTLTTDSKACNTLCLAPLLFGAGDNFFLLYSRFFEDIASCLRVFWNAYKQSPWSVDQWRF